MGSPSIFIDNQTTHRFADNADAWQNIFEVSVIFSESQVTEVRILGVPSWQMHLNVKGPRSGSQCLPAAPWWGRPLRSLHRPCLKLELPDHSGSPSGQGQGLPIREHEHLQRERRPSSLCLQRNTLQLSSIKSGVQFSLVTLEVGRKLCTQFVNGNEQLHCLSLSFKPILQSIHILIRNSVKHNWEITLLSNHPLIIEQREARKNCQFEGYPLSRPHHFRLRKCWAHGEAGRAESRAYFSEE